MKKPQLISIAVAVALITAGMLSAYAQVKPDVLVKQRQAAMTLQGKYFGPLAAMAQGKIPYDAKIVARNASYLDALDKMPWDGFAPATKGVKSQALPAVFSDTAKFQDAQKRLQTEVSKLASVSKGGDEAATKAQIGAVGKACANCHDDFREKQ